MSLIRKHGAVLQAWACLDLVLLLHLVINCGISKSEHSPHQSPHVCCHTTNLISDLGLRGMRLYITTLRGLRNLPMCILNRPSKPPSLAAEPHFYSNLEKNTTIEKRLVNNDVLAALIFE